MIFEDGFELKASPDVIMQKFSDIESVSRCIPGLEMTGTDAEGSYLGTMSIAFGPKKLKFSGKVNCVFDHENKSGKIVGGGVNGSRSATVKASTQFHILPLKAEATGEVHSRVEIRSEIELGGVIESFASTGGIALGKHIMKQFAHNLSEQMRVTEQTVASCSPDSAAVDGAHAPPAPATSLNVFALLWQTLVAFFRPSKLKNR
jgi:Uncharacterized conserved protein